MTGRRLDKTVAPCVLHSHFKTVSGDSEDGLLCEDDFTMLMNLIGVFDDDAVESLRKLADLDGDGKVSLAEFCHLVKRQDVMRIIHDRRFDDSLKLMKSVVDLFVAYDTDRNGEIDWMEWQRAYARCGYSVGFAAAHWKLVNPEGCERLTFDHFFFWMIEVKIPEH